MVKYAQALTLALQSIEFDNKLQFYNQLKIQFEKQKAIAFSIFFMEYSNQDEIKHPGCCLLFKSQFWLKLPTHISGIE
jgi:hypothetical protein